MSGIRVIAAAGLGVLVAAGIAVAPALGAGNDSGNRKDVHRPMTLGLMGGIGSFTPASADPKLAAALARSGLGASGFRFTPSEAPDGSDNGVALAVHGRTARGDDRDQDASAKPASVSLTPIAYNLGVAVGWKRFAITGDMSHVDLAGQPGSSQSVDVGVSYTGHRVSGRIKATSEKPLDSSPRLIAENPNYTIDVGGSYSLTRNLDVTAGVRYKSEQDRNRLQQVDDTRHDSQAVYIGTAFRF